MSILYSKSLREFRKPNFKLYTEFASRSMIYSSGRAVRNSLHKSSSKMLQFLPENLQHTQLRMNKMRLSAVNFIRESWAKSLNNGIAYSRVGFECICATFSRQYTELFYKFFTRATESGNSMGRCYFRNILPINVRKLNVGKIYNFLTRNFQSRQNSTIGNLVFALALQLLLKLLTLSFKKDTITAKIV